MKQLLLFIAILFYCDSMMSQNIQRIEVNGVILADNNDVENITVYNASSNKGTITNGKGEFTIHVALHDIIEISALQFKTVSITITEDAIASKQLKIYLAEQVNQLGAVLLSTGLSGDLVTDIDNTEELPKIELDLGNMNALEYFDDNAFNNDLIRDELNRIVSKGQFYNGIDFASLLGINKLLQRKRKQSNFYKKDEKPKDLLDVYSHKFISEFCNIPFEKVELFVAFIEAEGIKDELYKPENEVYLLEYLMRQSKEFLMLEDAKH
ncbi:carboxypeptidase-like regulatory domain-containing protein [Hwangdonia lutea]|uniref:Carboxypeptidase-like regulatory domain-containing protein n=1 Tax=Hwangdonia lutea TaxID=3075823 RepID=A0AA97EJ15_9FLAO|nr:carboxypeptidase-like regulatory domain-containing protein [Hwangdonia sp. SCSIO 19198]WOD42356.1 carboxypeptidase-like regulatory domain-containing protein [Hwangdonia sp. SCSIO 19198]